MSYSVTKIELPGFGELEFEISDDQIVQEDYDFFASTSLGDKTIGLELYLDAGGTLSSTEVAGISRFLEKIKQYNNAALEQIRTDYYSDDSGVVGKFIRQQQKETGRHYSVDMFYLINVSFFPTGGDSFAIFSYGLDSEMVGPIMTMRFDQEGETEYLSRENLQAV